MMIPAALAYQAAHQLRWRLTRPARAPVPVICVGNASLGGSGKTPFAMLAADLLGEGGVRAVFLTRGYGGALTGPVVVNPDRHDADDIGDEALLLARYGPVVVSRRRHEGAILAAQQGAQVIIMDDGFQNPSLHKDMSILIIGADEQESNGALFPAGPFRERPASARARATITVCVGAENGSADFHAWLAPENAPAPERIVAFAGIGKPEKFFASVEACGFEIAARIPFPDHHRFTAAELSVLKKTAAKEQARLICTEKDFVRLPQDFRQNVLTLPVVMQVNDPARLKQHLLSVMSQPMHSPHHHNDD